MLKRVCTFAERLRQGMDLANLKASDLSRLSGIGKSSLSHYINVHYEGKQDAVYLLSKALNVSEAWLMGYDVPMQRSAPAPVSAFPAPTITEDVVTFPVLGEIAAGYDHIALEDWEGDTLELPARYLRGRPATAYFVLRVKGDSMYPDYREGDKVLVLRQDTLDYSGQVGAILYDGELATLKRVEFAPGEDWLRLVPINPQFPAKRIAAGELEQCRVLGVPRFLFRELDT